MSEPTGAAFDRLGSRLVGRGVEVVFVVLVAIIITGAATGTAAAQQTSAPNCSTVSYNGDGSSASPFEVSNLDQLQCINENHADVSDRDRALNRNYRLVSDIDASDTAFWNSRDGFEPIGEDPSFGTQFTGTFDGNGHEIADLNINRPNRDSVGLFGAVGASGTATGVSVVDAVITGDREVGVLAGSNSGGTVSESSASGDVTADGRAGSLVGISFGTVSDSSASGDVTGVNTAGGLVGFNDGGTVSNSSASGDVTGVDEAGGLVGENSNTGSISDSSTSGAVTGEDSNIGGLVGFNDGTVTNSSASGAVEGDEHVGGLVGENTDVTSESSAFGDVEGNDSVGGLVGISEGGTVEKSYARGNATGNDSVGGLVGKNEEDRDGNPGTVRRSYATGDVTGPFNFDPIDPGPGPVDPISTQNDIFSGGGLVGNNSAGTVTNSYWDVNTTGQSSSDGGGTGLTTAEMVGSAATNNMQGFDFASTWVTVPGDYPILSFQSEDGGSCPFDPVVCTYDPNGDIDTGDLQAAINDFIQRNISTGDLQAVINAFIQS